MLYLPSRHVLIMGGCDEQQTHGLTFHLRLKGERKQGYQIFGRYTMIMYRTDFAIVAFKPHLAALQIRAIIISHFARSMSLT